MAIPHRGTTSQSTYFITASAYDKKSLFQADRCAELFLDVLFGYRKQRKFTLHEFVLMPDHFHLLLTPIGITLERAVQLIKGGFSFRVKKELGFGGEVWQSSFFDRRVRDKEEFNRFRSYIHQNPVKRGLCSNPSDYPYSSGRSGFQLDQYLSG